MEQGSGAVQRYGTPFWPCRSAPGALQAGHQEVGWVFLSLFFSFFLFFLFWQIGILFGSILSTELSSVTLPLLLPR